MWDLTELYMQCDCGGGGVQPSLALHYLIHKHEYQSALPLKWWIKKKRISFKDQVRPFLELQ